MSLRIWAALLVLKACEHKIAAELNTCNLNRDSTAYLEYCVSSILFCDNYCLSFDPSG